MRHITQFLVTLGHVTVALLLIGYIANDLLPRVDRRGSHICKESK